MSFSYNPAELELPLNHLRFRVQDTDSDNYLFEDEEINFVAADETNIWRAAAELCRAAATKFVKQVGLEDVDAIKFQPEEKAKQYRALAKDFDEKADALDESLKSSSTSGLSMPKLPTSSPTFTRDLHK